MTCAALRTIAAAAISAACSAASSVTYSSVTETVGKTVETQDVSHALFSHHTH
jgi:hypothetical protein